MRAEERRRLELVRLADEIEADLKILDGIAEQCRDATPALAQPNRAITAMVAVDLHRYYTALENVLERIERTTGALPFPGPSWHRDLLLGATRGLADARPPILSSDTGHRLLDLLAFRHFFRHAYTADFEAPRLAALTMLLASLHPTLVVDLGAFLTHLRNLAAGLAQG